jgi:hypothetical protein
MECQNKEKMRRKKLEPFFLAKIRSARCAEGASVDSCCITRFPIILGSVMYSCDPSEYANTSQDASLHRSDELYELFGGGTILVDGGNLDLDQCNASKSYPFLVGNVLYERYPTKPHTEPRIALQAVVEIKSKVFLFVVAPNCNISFSNPAR